MHTLTARRTAARESRADVMTTTSGPVNRAATGLHYFDKQHFVLDTEFSSIIYILYEGAGLSLPVVTQRSGGCWRSRIPKEAEWRRRLRRPARRRRPRRSGKRASSCGGAAEVAHPQFSARTLPAAGSSASIGDTAPKARGDGGVVNAGSG